MLYIFDFGEFHFIVIDPTTSSPIIMNFTKELRDWVEDDLSNIHDIEKFVEENMGLAQSVQTDYLEVLS